jgi:hypothetical protein
MQATLNTRGFILMGRLRVRSGKRGANMDGVQFKAFQAITGYLGQYVAPKTSVARKIRYHPPLLAVSYRLSALADSG